jgi:hypothetical protein
MPAPRTAGVSCPVFRHLCLHLFEIIYWLTSLSQGTCTHGPDRAAVLIHHVIDDSESASPARGPTHHMLRRAVEPFWSIMMSRERSCECSERRRRKV